jgi:hypothetical protein
MTIAQRLLPMAQQAQGVCHSCRYQERFELPVSGTVYYCKAFHIEHDATSRNNVRGCPKWKVFLPQELARRSRAQQNPLFAQAVESDDKLFWELQVHLQSYGLDLKTVLVLAQPALRDAREVTWVDHLEHRFADDTMIEQLVRPLAEIIDEMRALGYNSVCDVLAKLVNPTNVHP